MSFDEIDTLSLLQGNVSLLAKHKQEQERWAGQHEAEQAASELAAAEHWAMHRRTLTADQKDAIACYLKDSVPISLLPDNFDGKAPFQTCAVVSNSGALHQHTYGSEIDDHGFSRLESMKDDTLYVWTDQDEPVSKARDNSPNPDNVYELESDAWQAAEAAINDIYSGRWFELDGAVSMDATTGFMGMLTALSNCESVDAYEMTDSSYAAQSPYHYYDSPENGLNANQNSWHQTFSAEKDLWMRISTTSEDEVRSSGKATLRGFSQLNCQDVEDVVQVFLLQTARGPS